ncbi:hypothetical protein ACA910_014808 [Epithemia clementina (nom. ined.)]
MAQPATGAMVKPPDTYLEKYTQMRDILDGAYIGYLEQYAAENGYTSNELRQRVHTTTTTLPQVFAALIRQRNTYMITALHRPAVYSSTPGDPRPWDDRMLVFNHDLELGNYIDMVEFPVEGWDEAAAQHTPTMAQLDVLLAADNELGIAPMQAAGAADTEELTVRYLVSIPHRYIHLLLPKNLTTREAWDRIGGAIRNDGAEIDCDLLLQWLRVTMTASNAAGEPATYLGTYGTVFPPLRVDRDLQRHRWELLLHDFPHLDTTRLSIGDQTAQLVQSLRLDRAAERAADAASRMAATAPALPSTKFPETTPVWLRFCTVVDEADLPPLYHRWANAAKAERRIAFQSLLEERAQRGEAATNIAPFVTKELHEQVLMGRFAPRTYEADDLTVGINPFTCGFQNSDRDRDVVVRTQNFDLMLQGHTQPTLAEQETFRTKDVPLPNTIYEAGLQLKATSVVLDVVLGCNAPICNTLRFFCRDKWPHIEAHLNLSADDHTPVLPLILCWVQLELSAYLNDLRQGRPSAPPPPPNFDQLGRIITRRAYHQFSPMPIRYRVTPTMAPTPASSAVGGAISAAPSTAGTPGAASRDPGPRVENPTPVAAFQTAFTAANIRIAQLRDHAPTTTDPGTNTTVPLCLSYHLRGSCYANCQRGSTHRTLNAGEKRRMSSFVAQHLPTTGQGTGTDAATPP